MATRGKNTPGRKRQTTAFFEPSLHEDVKAAAARDGISMARWLRRAARRELKRQIRRESRGKTLVENPDV